MDSQKEVMFRRLRICMLLPFPCYSENMRVPPQIGICSYLTKFGHEVTWVIWSENRHQVQPFLFNNVQVYVTPEIHYLPVSSLLARILNKVPNTVKRMCFVLRIFKEEKYDLIFVRDDVFDGLIATYIRRKYGIPFVFELSNPLEQDWISYKIEPKKPRFVYYFVFKLTKFIGTRLLHKANLILPISNGLKEHLVAQGIPEPRIMPVSSGVEIEAFSNRDGRGVGEKYRLGNSRVIIYIGTLGKPRHMSVLVQAFSRVKHKRGNAKLLVVGEGSDEKNLKSLARELGMEEDVIFTGQVPQVEIPNFIATADIGVSAVPPFSFYKVSSPIKMFEYMAMAKPVVANEEIYEHKEVLEQSGGGILVPFIPGAFAQAIIELLDNPKKAAEMGQRGREWVVKNRTYEILARQVEEKFANLVGKNWVGVHGQSRKIKA